MVMILLAAERGCDRDENRFGDACNLFDEMIEWEKLKFKCCFEGELYGVDSVNSDIVRITPPLSQYSGARLIVRSFQGYTGHVDRKPNDARLDHPKGVTMDDKGNVYVDDTCNLAIRKIGETGLPSLY
ncbi:NHL repeat-containing protein [Tanacetum coccineum]